MPFENPVLTDFARQPDLRLLSPAALRLSRRMPEFTALLDPLPLSPVQRALAGLPADPQPVSLAERLALLQARTDGGLTPPLAEAAALEEACRGDVALWVPAARLHVLASPAREQAARMALSFQDLPYVFPGELHPLMVELFAVGDRILTALHIDWARRLADWLGEALILDLRALGLWTWPLLTFFPERRLHKPLLALSTARRLPPGALGLGAAYLARAGGSPEPLLSKAGPADQLHYALAMAGERAR
jgi:hypothetical protein